MLINNWYVACAAAEVTAGKALRVQMLGCHFVLFRDAAGAVACLADTCPHRGAAREIELGKINGPGYWFAAVAEKPARS